MAPLAEGIRQLAHHLHAASPLGCQGVLERIFEALQRQRLIAIRIEYLGLDSTSIKVHPDAMGALKKEGHRRSANPEADGTPKFIGRRG